MDAKQETADGEHLNKLTSPGSFCSSLHGTKHGYLEQHTGSLLR